MALEGKLADISLIDLLRAFQRDAPSGRLLLWNDAEWAMVWLQGGRPVNATVMAHRSRKALAAAEEAIFRVGAWQAGRFRFLASSAPELYLVTIRRSATELIREALRRSSRGAEAPSPQKLMATTPLRLLPRLASDDAAVHLSVDEWLVLTQIERQTTPLEIAAQTRLSLPETIAIVARLVERGLVARAPALARPEGGLARTTQLDHRAGAAPPSPAPQAARHRIEEAGASSA